MIVAPLVVRVKVYTRKIQVTKYEKKATVDPKSHFRQRVTMLINS